MGISKVIIALTLYAYYYVIKNTPKVSLNGNYLEYVTSYRYLGFCIHECNDDQDIKRQLRRRQYSTMRVAYNNA